jgi:hypothetical protein
MEIKKAFQKLSEPQKYGPVVAGGIAGVFGGVYALDILKSYVPVDNDMADWLAKGGFTAAMVVGMMVVKPKTENDTVKVAIQTALLTAAVTGGIVMAIKAFGWGPLTIGRVGAVGAASRGLARTRVNVVGKPTPTFAQAPVQMTQQPGVFSPAFAEQGIGAY